MGNLAIVTRDPVETCLVPHWVGMSSGMAPMAHFAPSVLWLACTWHALHLSQEVHQQDGWSSPLPC